MRRLLVTGGAGFIGSNFVHYWVARHPDDRVVVLDALTYAGDLRNLAGAMERPNVRFVKLDICETDAVESLMRQEGIDTVVHFAAESHVDRSIQGPDAFIQTNVVGTHSLLQAARKLWLTGQTPVPHRFHHVSTDEVFGSLGPTDPAFTELTPYAPNSPYSASKAASDHLVRAYHHTYGLATTTSCCSNNYGPRQFPEKLIPLMLTNLLRGLPLPVYGDGRNIRDWLHVDDHCAALEAILLRGHAGETYNIGGRSELQNIDLVRQICQVVAAAFATTPELKTRFPDSPFARGQAAEGSITFVRDRPGHDRRYAIDCTKLAREINFVPQVKMAEGLASTVGWYLANEAWWRSILKSP